MVAEPVQRYVTVNDVTLSLWEWSGSGRLLLFAHANGFHGRCWDQVITRLGTRHCFAVDLRGHGQSDKPPPPYQWRWIGEDLAALVQALDLHDVIAIGHSLGGHAVTLAAALVPERLAALLLLDPVVLPPEAYGDVIPGEHFAARRRNEWSSPTEMYERFKDRPPFNTWDRAVLHDYCTHGLLPAPNGTGFVLACPPAIEASIYMAVTAADIYPEIATIQIPVRVVRARGQRDPSAVNQTNVPSVEDFSKSPTAPDLASHFPHGTDVYLAQHSHFIPMEAPALVAQYVEEMAAD